MAAPPVDPAALDAVWRAAAASGRGPLCVAVSGGGDSLALLALLRRHEPLRPLRALIVDHAIQADAAVVAAQAAERAQSLGVDAEVIQIQWQSARAPQDHARARAARYRALAKAMRRYGAAVLALGHTLDDQAETALIKRARLGAWSHAAGMTILSPLPDWPFGFGLWAARPLLGVRRQALRDWLEVNALAWRDDPVNEAPRYLRARARSLVAANAVDPMRLAAFAASLRRRQQRRDAAAFAALSARAQMAEGQAWFDPDLRRPADLRALAALWAAVAGAPRAPAPAALARALQAGAATLGGVQLRREGAGVRLAREASCLAGRPGVRPMAPLALTPGFPVLVDDRLFVTARRPGLRLMAQSPEGLVVKDAGEAAPLARASDVSTLWLTHAHLQHHLAPGDPFIPCGGAEGVQQALGLLS